MLRNVMFGIRRGAASVGWLAMWKRIGSGEGVCCADGLEWVCLFGCWCWLVVLEASSKTCAASSKLFGKELDGVRVSGYVNLSY